MTGATYHNLREQLEGLLTEGRQFGKRAAEWVKISTYWHIGDALSGFLARHGGATRHAARVGRSYIGFTMFTLTRGLQS